MNNPSIRSQSRRAKLSDAKIRDKDSLVKHLQKHDSIKDRLCFPFFSLNVFF